MRTEGSAKAGEGLGSLHYVVVNGLRFAYLEQGQGPLALLLHGFPDTPLGWRPLISVLAAAGYRVVAPFTRGYAPTQAPPDRRATTVEDLAADALALIDALGERAAVLVGHDWGAATAYLATAMEPTRIDKLVAVGIPHPATIRPSLRLLWQGRHFIGLRLPGAAARLHRRQARGVEAYYRRWSPTWDFAPEETVPVRECFADLNTVDAALSYYRGFRPGYVSPPLRQRIDRPTMVVAGEDDPAFPISAYEAASHKFTGRYEVVALPGGHFVQRESASGFADAVLGFLSQ